MISLIIIYSIIDMSRNRKIRNESLSLENVDITSSIINVEESREIGERLIPNSCSTSTISTVTKLTVKPLNDLSNLQSETVTLESCLVFLLLDT